MSNTHHTATTQFRVWFWSRLAGRIWRWSEPHLDMGTLESVRVRTSKCSMLKKTITVTVTGRDRRSMDSALSGLVRLDW
jgi:hypothetical protein